MERVWKTYKRNTEMIVVVGGIKGGTGKTTLATNLAVFRSKESKVLLIDADEQKTAYNWAQQREQENIQTEWTTIILSGASLGAQVLKLQKYYQDIIIDVGGRDTKPQRSALTVANAFVVPFQPRSFDIWTIDQLGTLIDEVNGINENLRSYCILNRADSIGKDNEDALNILKDWNKMICLENCIGQRKSFPNASANGFGVLEMKKKDEKAVTEIQNLYNILYRKNTVSIQKT